MPRARSADAAVKPAPPPAPLEDIEGEPAIPSTPEEDEKISFFDYLKSLDDPLLNKAVVYVYRLSPKIKKLGGHAIDKYSARMFSEDMLKEEHGGGRYKLILDTGVKATNITRVIEIVGTPAKIFPDQILVDEQGNPLPVQPAATAEDSSKSDLVNVLKTFTQAIQENKNPAQVVQETVEVMKQASAGAMELLTNALKMASGVAPAGQAPDGAMLNELRALNIAIREMKNGASGGIAEKVMSAAVDRLVNPPATPLAPDLFDGLKKLGQIANPEGLGVLRALLGAEKDSFWESAGKTLIDGLSSAVRDNFPNIMQWMRERAWYTYVEKMSRQQAQTQPAQSVPMPPPQPALNARVPLPNPAPAAAVPAAATPATSSAQLSQDDEMFKAMQVEITSLIKRCWDFTRRDDDPADGAAAATMVKLAYPSLMPFIRAQFNDLEKLKQLAAQDPVLGAISGHPEFPQFSKDFFDELHNADGGEPPSGSA